MARTGRVILAGLGVAVALAIPGLATATPVHAAVTDSDTLTPTPTPTPTSTPCVPGTVYGSKVGSGPIAIVAGAGIENGTKIHNKSSAAITDAIFDIGVIGNGQVMPAKEGMPTVEWSVDGGAWHKVSLTYHKAQGSSGLPTWDSQDVDAPTIPAHGSRLFRIWMSFTSTNFSGVYNDTFYFATPDCAALGDSGFILFGYSPGSAPTGPGAHTAPGATTNKVVHQ